jgi:hypothetical protein
MAEAKWVTPDELQKLVSAVLEQDILEQELPPGDSSTPLQATAAAGRVKRELENAGVAAEQIEQWALGAAQLALGDFSMTQQQREAAADSIAALYGYGLQGRPTGEEGVVEYRFEKRETH